MRHASNVVKGLLLQDALHDCREKKRRIAAEQQLAEAVATAATDGARWREEVLLKQARIDMLMAGDRAKEADFMAQRVKELQVIVAFACRQSAQEPSCATETLPLLHRHMTSCCKALPSSSI